jgi:hypothetical protein
MDNPFPCKNCIVFPMCLTKLNSYNNLNTNFLQIFKLSCKPVIDFLVAGDSSKYFERRNEILTQFNFPEEYKVNYL